MTVSATASASRSLPALALMVAGSSTFQTLLGVQNDIFPIVSASNHVFYPTVDDTLDVNGNLVNDRPRVIINPGMDFELTRFGVQNYQCTGNLYMHFEFPPVGTTPADQLMNFMNQYGGIIDDIWNAAQSHAGGDAYLNITGIKLFDGPGAAAEENERGELFYGASFEVSWQ